MATPVMSDGVSKLKQLLPLAVRSLFRQISDLDYHLEQEFTSSPHKRQDFLALNFTANNMHCVPTLEERGSQFREDKLQYPQATFLPTYNF